MNTCHAIQGTFLSCDELTNCVHKTCQFFEIYDQLEYYYAQLGCANLLQNSSNRSYHKHIHRQADPFRPGRGEEGTPIDSLQ